MINLFIDPVQLLCLSVLEMEMQYCVCDSCTEVCGVLLLMNLQMPLSAYLLPTLALAQLYFSSAPLAPLSPPLPLLIVKEWLCVICFVSPEQSFSCWYLFYGQLEKTEAQGVWTVVSYHIPTHIWHIWVFISFGYFYSKNKIDRVHACKKNFLYTFKWPLRYYTPITHPQIYKFIQNTMSTKKRWFIGLA